MKHIKIKHNKGLSFLDAEIWMPNRLFDFSFAALSTIRQHIIWPTGVVRSTMLVNLFTLDKALQRQKVAKYRETL